MSLFWILAAVLIALGVVLLAPSLLRGARDDGSRTDRREQNIAIARDRLRELDAEHARGEMGEAEWQQARQELELALASDLSDEAVGGTRTGGGRWALLGLVLFVPLLTLGIYTQVGSPQHIRIAGPGAGGGNPHAGADNAEKLSIEEMVQKLSDRLEAEPNNPDGWYMLGRSYMSMGRYADAVKALQKLRAQIGDHPTALVMLADATAMSQGGRVAGEPEELVLKALAQEPDNVTALWLAGNAAEEQGQYSRALAFWKRAEKGLADQPQMLTELRNLMEAAERQGGTLPVAETPAPAAAGPSLNVNVALAPELAAKAKPDDLVFIFARAVSGPPMPLAAARVKVADLPMQVTLDDSMAMMPQMKLSGFSEVQVGARVALSGQPIAQSGDLQSDAAVVSVAQGVNVDLVIDREVP